jgi:hypothetical protein
MFENITLARKVIIALCLANLSILPTSYFINLFSFGVFYITAFFYLLGVIGSVIGIIFGIQGLKSTEKLFAKVSIFFATLNLILLILSAYAYLAIGYMASQ